MVLGTRVSPRRSSGPRALGCTQAAHGGVSPDHGAQLLSRRGALSGRDEVKEHEGVGPGSCTVCSSSTHEATQLWELHREAPRDKALPLTCAPTHGITDPSPELCSISLPSPGLSPPQGLPVCLLPVPRAVACPHLLRPHFLGGCWGCLPRRATLLLCTPVLYLDLAQRMCCEQGCGLATGTLRLDQSEQPSVAGATTWG